MNIGANMIEIAVTGLLLGGLATGAGATGLVQLPAVTPEVSQSRFTGHHDPRARLDISMALPLRNAAALDAFLHQLQDRSSPNYHKFLTQKEFTAAYGPTSAQVKEVEAFLKQRGLTVTSVSKGRTRIHASADTATVESAFGVAVNDYSYQGEVYFAASTGPTLPQDVAGLVTHVFGLEDMPRFKSHELLSPSSVGATTGVGPTGFSPQQIATAYGWPALTAPKKGAAPATGVTIAIATAFAFRQADVDHFWSTYGLPAHTVTVEPVDGFSRRLDGETTLDVERSSAMSPGSNIRVYEAVNSSNGPFDDVFEAIADDNAADVVSTSWGEPEIVAESDHSAAAEHSWFQQMAAQGMTFIAASGDSGSSDNVPGTDNADFPSSDPLTVAAGGTSLSLNSDGNIASEVVWLDHAGGADSILFTEPPYQSALPGWASNSACDGDHIGDFPDDHGVLGWGCTAAGAASRQTSDIAMDADPDTGYSVYYNGRWGEAGGTSFVAPEMAGFYAIVTARLRTALHSKTLRGGQGNPGLYEDFLINPVDFNDITSGSNGMFNAQPGWDHPTGLGTPHDADTFINDMVIVLSTG